MSQLGLQNSFPDLFNLKTWSLRTSFEALKRHFCVEWTFSFDTSRYQELIWKILILLYKHISSRELDSTTGFYEEANEQIL